jgi:hypothetical protein
MKSAMTMELEYLNVVKRENLIVNITVFPHRNISKYTWTSPEVDA